MIFDMGKNLHQCPVPDFQIPEISPEDLEFLKVRRTYMGNPLVLSFLSPEQMQIFRESVENERNHPRRAGAI